MAKILVTGGLGFIGSHTCVELIKSNNEIVIVDNLSNSNMEVHQVIEQLADTNISFYEVDCKNFEKLNTIFKEQTIDTVIHFAAYKAVGESQKLALDYYTNNISSLTTLLECMREHKVDKLIFSSSCTVYGTPDVIPVDENESIKNAESVYGTTKIMAEKIIEDVSNSEFKLKAVILRYFNPVGAHESGLIGENPKGMPTNLFPIILQVINGERAELQIFGHDYDTKDGTAVRDYIHVVDLAKAHCKAVDSLSKRPKKIAYYNLGTGIGYSVLEIVKEYERQINKPIAHKLVDRREGDVEKVWGDSTLAQNKLNWKTELDLSDMVNSSLKWNKLNYGK